MILILFLILMIILIKKIKEKNEITENNNIILNQKLNMKTVKTIRMNQDNFNLKFIPII